MKIFHWTILVIALAGAVCGCAAAPHYRRDPQIERSSTSEIEGLERQIAQHRDELARVDLECGDACRSADAICDAATRICVIAADLGDGSADARCDRAQATCAESRELVVQRCVCEGTASTSSSSSSFRGARSSSVSEHE